MRLSRGMRLSRLREDLDLNPKGALRARADLVEHHPEVVVLEPLLHEAVRRGQVEAVLLDLPEGDGPEP